jgi:hypothetical protein
LENILAHEVQYSHNEIHENASATIARRKVAVRIDEKEFQEAVGVNLWSEFKSSVCDYNNEAIGFYKSKFNGKDCYFVDAGNIDRVFI